MAAVSGFRTNRTDKESAEEKQIGSKTFRLQDGIWVDTTHTPQHTLLKIKRGSQAYHDLLKALPELKAYFEIGKHVIVNIGKYSIEIADEGKTTLTEEELTQLMAAVLDSKVPLF